MVFKVDYDKVSEVGNSLVTKSDELESLYLELIDICKDIDENWRSEDSSVYVGQMISYVKEKENENTYLYNTGSTLKNISSLYGEQNEKWANDLMNSDLIKKEKMDNGK